MGWSDKNFKVTVINITEKAVTNIHETNDKVESICKETEDAKKKQMEFLTLKVKIPEIVQLENRGER